MKVFESEVVCGASYEKRFVHRRVLVSWLFDRIQQRGPFLGACAPDFVYLTTEHHEAVV